MKSQYIVTLLVLSIFALSRVGVAQQTAEKNGNQFEPGKVLAIVGGEPIFVGDLLFDANQFLEKNAPGAPESARAELRPQIIQRMLPSYINQRLLLIDVKNGLPPEADFDEIVENASKEFDKSALANLMEMAGANTPAEFDAQLRAQGSSLRTMRISWTTTQFVRAMMLDKVRSDVDVSHRELLDYYREHLDDYKNVARSKWEQIMVRFDRFESKDAARQAIVELGDKVVFGASLDGVAKKHSHGYAAHAGGQHDWTTRDSLVLKEIDHAIFTLPVGKLSDVIESKRGYHIVRVVERDDESVTSFRDAQIEIKKKIEGNRRVAAYESYLADLKRRIPVEIVEDSAVRTASFESSSQQGSATR